MYGKLDRNKSLERREKIHIERKPDVITTSRIVLNEDGEIDTITERKIDNPSQILDNKKVTESSIYYLQATGKINEVQEIMYSPHTEVDTKYVLDYIEKIGRENTNINKEN